MIINDEGLGIIKKWEGCSLVPYLDPIGIPTIGVGSIWSFDGGRVTMDHRQITKAEADGLLKKQLGRTQGFIDRLVSVPVNENQFSALCSLISNIGSGNFQASSLRAKLNRLDYWGASNEFWKWRRAGGRILRGLVLRRKDETELFVKEIL